MTYARNFYEMDDQGPFEKGQLIRQTNSLSIYRYVVAPNFSLNGQPMRNAGERSAALYVGYSRPSHLIVALYLCQENSLASACWTRPVQTARWSDEVPGVRSGLTQHQRSTASSKHIVSPGESDFERWLASVGVRSRTRRAPEK
jgi:hypothetical protein